MLQPRPQGATADQCSPWVLEPTLSPPVVSPGFRKTNQRHNPSSSPVAAHTLHPLKPSVLKFGSSSVLYFTPPTPSSAPLGYGFLLQPWEAALHSAQAGEQAPFVDAFPSLLALPLFWASPTPYSPVFSGYSNVIFCSLILLSSICKC